LLHEASPGDRVRVVTPLRMKLRGGRSWLTAEDGEPVAPPTTSRSLVDGVRSAHAILESHGMSLDGNSALGAKAPANPYHRKLCQLALLSPDIQRSILSGRQPASLSVFDLLAEPPPLLWSEQGPWLAARAGNGR
jgi:site-specific DNA recombinase